MVTEGKCFITKYGSIHKTEDEAKRIEEEEDKSHFVDRIRTLTRSEGRFYPETVADIAGIVYSNAGIFIIAMREFGLLPSEPIAIKTINVDNIQTEELKKFWQHAVYFSRVCAGIAAKIPDLPVSHIEQVALDVYKYRDIFKEAMIVTKIFDDY